ncbi:MAG: hypothetical protein K2Y37_04070 [Pirellulales bacterium]|nr:hypothetical protein [Pirellulales bacterium]
MTEPIDDTPNATADPGYNAVRKYLLYTLSLPERTLRTGVGMVGGAVRESSSLLVPQAFQNSRTYSMLVRQMLDYLVEDIGGVRSTAGDQKSTGVENFIARKAIGNFAEMASLATLHISPITLLAIVSDAAYGSRTFLRELAAELKREGLIDEQSTIDSLDDFLNALGGAAGKTSSALDTPPLSLAGLRQTVDETRQAVAKVDPRQVLPQAELERLWGEMRELAKREQVGLLELSGTMTLHALDKLTLVGRGALSGLRVSGGLFNRHVIDHYQTALSDIRARGVYATLAAVSGPYIEAVWHNYAHDRPTWTEDLVTGRLFRRAWHGTCAGAGKAWSAIRGKPTDTNATSDDDSLRRLR